MGGGRPQPHRGDWHAAKAEPSADLDLSWPDERYMADGRRLGFRWRKLRPLGGAKRGKENRKKCIDRPFSPNLFAPRGRPQADAAPYNKRQQFPGVPRLGICSDGRFGRSPKGQSLYYCGRVPQVVGRQFSFRQRARSVDSSLPQRGLSPRRPPTACDRSAPGPLRARRGRASPACGAGAAPPPAARGDPPSGRGSSWRRARRRCWRTA